MAERRAILIGVDGYSFQPLTSAVNDAVALRDSLVSRSTPSLPAVFEEADITLLAAPGVAAPPIPGGLPATRNSILSTLRPLYDTHDPAELLLVFFAGHGLAVSPDGRVRETLILPSDV